MKYITLCLILIVISCIDIKKKIIPDVLIILGIAIGLYFNFSINAILGMIMGFMLLHTESEIRCKFNKGSIGGGDKKLMAMIGLFIGLYNIMIVYLLQFLFKIIVRCVKKTRNIELAPYIALATLLVMIYG